MTTLKQDTDALIKKHNFDRNEHYYGSLSHIEDEEELIDMMEVFADYLEQGMSEEYITKLHFMRELERELTLRESQ
jgi:hypothetical protein